MNENVNMNIMPQIEVILKSIKLEDRSLLDPILNSKEVDKQEKTDILKYLKILEITPYPSIPLLQKEIPGRNFEVEAIEPEMLSDYIQMYLYSKKNLDASKKLIELSSKVRNEGLTEDIANQLTNITKSDSVQHKFTNIKDKIIDRYENAEYSVGLSTGIEFVDEMTGGIHKGEVSTIVAFTGHGKTTLAVNIAYNALLKGNNILYLSLEVSKESIYFDFISRHSNSPKFKMRVGHYDLKKRALKPEVWEYTKNTIIPDFNNLSGQAYIADETEIDSYTQFSLESKFREIDKIATEETGHGIDVVVIDHAQLLKFNGKRQVTSTGDVINEFVSYFRQSALNWLKTGRQVAFVILSQANRGGYDEARNNNGKYSLLAMAEANELERASTLILSVYGEKDMLELGITKVQILKYRDSRSDDDPTEVNVDLQYYLFGDLSEGASAIKPEISDDTSKLLNSYDNGNVENDIMAEFSEFLDSSNKGGL